MKRYLSFGALFAALALLATGCFTLQSFSVLATSVVPGGTTKAQFVMHPYSVTAGTKAYEFVVVGVPAGGDLKVGSAKWDTTGAFSGPVAMVASAALPGAINTSGSCVANGLAFGSVTNTTWKGFITPAKVADKGKVDTKLITQVVIKASASATSDQTSAVTGVLGVWLDDGDGVVNGSDSFLCSGIGTVGLYVK